MFILELLIPVAILGGLGALVYFVVRGASGGEAFTFRTMLRAYLRLAYLVSLGVFLVGASMTLTAAMGSAFGHDFSYQNYSQPNHGPYKPGAPCPAPSGAGSTDCPGNGVGGYSPPPDQRQQEDLLRGISMLVGGLILGGAHRAGQLAMESKAERTESSLARGEAIIATVVFGLVVIIMVPVASYALLRYLVLGHTPGQYGNPGDPPGAQLAAAIVFLPAWLYYLLGVVRRARPATQ